MEKKKRICNFSFLVFPFSLPFLSLEYQDGKKMQGKEDEREEKEDVKERERKSKRMKEKRKRMQKKEDDRGKSKT